MAHDGSQKNSSRKTSRRGTRKARKTLPTFGTDGEPAHEHHLLPAHALALEGAPKECEKRDPPAD